MTNSLPYSKHLQNGQAVLVILLVMTVILTVGLSIVSRSITDVKISQQTQESARAFWVAQAGLEKAVKVGAGTSGTMDNSHISYTVTKSSLGGNEFVFPEKVKADEPATLWLVGHNESTGEIDPSVHFNDKLTIYWGDSGELSGTTPAIEATLIYSESNVFKNMHYAFDPNSGRLPSSNFSPALTAGPYTFSGQSFSFSSGEIDLSGFGTPYFFRLRLLFNSKAQPVGVKTSSSILPSQGNCFESLATVSESGVSRKLKQCQSWSITPNIFDYVLFSGGGI